MSMDGYKREVALTIYRSSAGKLFEGAPPPLLKSVVVLRVDIDAAGTPRRVSVLRSNGFRDLEQLAVESVRRAAPLPPPGAELLSSNGDAEFVETWLFRDDGRFQIRSLAETQASAEGMPD